MLFFASSIIVMVSKFSNGEYIYVDNYWFLQKKCSWSLMHELIHLFVSRHTIQSAIIYIFSISRDIFSWGISFLLHWLFWLEENTW
jgi:hypothetical protein